MSTSAKLPSASPSVLAALSLGPQSHSPCPWLLCMRRCLGRLGASSLLLLLQLQLQLQVLQLLLLSGPSSALALTSTHKFYHGTRPPIFPSSDLPLPLCPIDNSVMYFDNAMSPFDCAELVKSFEASSDEHFDGAVMVNGKVTIDPLLKKNTELFITELGSASESASGSPTWAAADSLLADMVQRHLVLYQEANAILSSQQSPFSDEGFRMKRYRSDSSEHHAYHSDSGHEISTKPHRILAVLLYLNTVAVGGETVFLQQGLTISPVCGRLAIFPTAFSFVHAGKRVVSEDKYVVINFLTT